MEGRAEEDREASSRGVGLREEEILRGEEVGEEEVDLGEVLGEGEEEASGEDKRLRFSLIVLREFFTLKIKIQPF